MQSRGSRNAEAMKMFLEGKYTKLKKENTEKQERRKQFELSLSEMNIPESEKIRMREEFEREETGKDRELRRKYVYTYIIHKIIGFL